MKLYNNYTKEPFSFLVNDTTLPSDNLLRMAVSQKIKTIDNKIQQNKDQYNLARQTAKIYALSSGKFVSMNF